MPTPAPLTTLLRPTRAGASPEQTLLWRCARVAPSADTLAAIERLGAALDGDGWARAAALAEREGVENLLYTHALAAGLGPAIPSTVAERLRLRYGAVALLARRLELRLERLLPALAERGAAAMPLKGAELARRVYGGVVTLRPVTDIDLLVRAEEADRWLPAFAAAGFSPVAGRGDPAGDHALRFHETQFRGESGLLLEAHVSLCRHPAYQRAFPNEEAWRRALPASVHGVATLRLAPEDELRFLSLHYATQHQATRLIWLVDVAELLRRGEFDWERLVDETVARRMAAPVAVTLLRAATLLDALVPGWAAEHLNNAARSPAEQRAWLAAQAPMRDWRRFLAQTLALDTLSGRLRLLRSGGVSLSRRLRTRSGARAAVSDTGKDGL